MENAKSETASEMSASAEVPPRPPLPKASRRKLLDGASRSDRAALLALTGIAALGVVGTITATAFAVRHYEDWSAVADQRDASASRVVDLEADLQKAKNDIQSARQALEPQRELAQRQSELATREADVKAREEAVAGREAAVTSTEQRVKATSLTGGKYTVGVSMEAGTYRTDNTNTSCYWAIYTSGTNYDDIVQNDLGSTGILTVTIREGQDFETNRCGTWLKIG
ncbi:hypothetical protein ACIQLJ_04850 [Microbacterium sp. NPDC091313]